MHVREAQEKADGCSQEHFVHVIGEPGKATSILGVFPFDRYQEHQALVLCKPGRKILTEPPLPSFRNDSQTLTASLKSPSIVANSASRRCWLGLPIPDMEPCELLKVWERAGGGGTFGGRDECGLDGEEVPKRRRVDENRRDGRRRVDEY